VTDFDLHEAAESGDLETVTLLVDQGAALEARDANGLTPLLRAVEGNRPLIVKFLLARDADPNAFAELTFGRPPFSITYGRVTALMRAVNAGFGDVVDILLAAGARTNEQTTDGGMTALMMAASRGYPRIAKTLLRHGADPNLTTEIGTTALHELAGVEGPLEQTAWPLQEELATALLDAGADVNAVVPITGSTPLLLAARWGHVALVRKFLERGADPARKDALGLSALMHATEHHHLEIARLLRSTGTK
jgi:hypothetical protein